jgi:hypothetical protein
MLAMMVHMRAWSVKKIANTALGRFEAESDGTTCIRRLRCPIAMRQDLADVHSRAELKGCRCTKPLILSSNRCYLRPRGNGSLPSPSPHRQSKMVSWSCAHAGRLHMAEEICRWRKTNYYRPSQLSLQTGIFPGWPSLWYAIDRVRVAHPLALAVLRSARSVRPFQRRRPQCKQFFARHGRFIPCK